PEHKSRARFTLPVDPTRSDRALGPAGAAPAESSFRSKDNAATSRVHRKPARQDAAVALSVQSVTTKLVAAIFPFCSRVNSNWTFCPSDSEASPARCTAVICTNTSFDPSSGIMNPYPLVGLNHLTVPRDIPVSPETPDQRRSRRQPPSHFQSKIPEAKARTP